tara:strand:- start:93 stop:497 length:405 start_codon:yes stop_codon:yes gene_type:complete
MIKVNYTYHAEVLRVVDGDTVIANVDVGFDMWKRCNIRLHGIDTPETRTRDLVEKEAGLKSKARLIELLEANDNVFILESMGIDKYGRSLGIIHAGYQDIKPWSDSIETRPVPMSVNELLITEGLAKPYFGGKR